MGGTGATFGQSFVNTLIQGQTIMAQVADRREHLELQKKLAAAQLQEHDVKTQLATRALTAQSDLRSRLQPQEWQGSELSPGGSAPAAPLSDAERMSFSAALDPHGAAKELLASGNRMTLKDMLTTQNAWVGGGQSGAPPTGQPQPRTLDVSGVNVPSGLESPTGKAFVHPGGQNYSTEKVSTIEMDGRVYNVPLLVPGQVGDIQGILANNPTQEQIQHAVKYSVENGLVMGPFTSQDEAVAAAKERERQKNVAFSPSVDPQVKGLGPTTQLERSSSVTFDKDGHPKLELKVGEKKLSLSLHHEFEPLPDGRVQNYQITFNPGTGQQNRVPVGAPQLPDAQKAYAQTAVAWGLKPGTEMFAMAIAEQVAATTMYQGQAQTIALNDVREKYTSLAGGGAKGAPAAAPTASPTARALAQDVEQAAKKTEQEALARTRAEQAAPIGHGAVNYLNRRTLQHPDPSTPTKDVLGNKDLVQVPPAQAQGIAYYPMVKTMLDELESIVTTRGDIYPASSGNTAKDIGAVAKATGMAKLKAKTDPDIGRLGTLQIGLPGVIKTFGDTANVAVAERAISEAALGTQPSTKEQALARIDLIRSLINESTSRYGLPPIPRKSGPKPAAVVPDKGEAQFDWDPTKGRLVPVKP